MRKLVTELKYLYSLLEEFHWTALGHVRCLHSSNDIDGAYCKKRNGHYSNWHSTGANSLAWKTERGWRGVPVTKFHPLKNMSWKWVKIGAKNFWADLSAYIKERG